MKKMPDSNLPETFTRGDRDNIVKVVERQETSMKTLDRLELAIKKIDDNTLSKMERLATEKADRKDVDEQNKRIESLENYRSWFVGVGVMIGVVITLVVYIYFNDINTIKKELQVHTEMTK